MEDLGELDMAVAGLAMRVRAIARTAAGTEALALSPDGQSPHLPPAIVDELVEGAWRRLLARDTPHDAAWLAMLALSAADLRGEAVSINQLSSLVGSGGDRAALLAQRLLESGLIELPTDDEAAADNFRLTPVGSRAMRAYLMSYIGLTGAKFE